MFQTLPEKRQRRDLQEEAAEEETGQGRVYKKVRKDQGVHVVKVDPKIYRAEAGGDREVRGKARPISFMQLNPKALNKRFSKKAAHIFEDIIGKGGLKGLRERIQRRG